MKCKLTCAQKKNDSDQPVHPHSLIRIFLFAHSIYKSWQIWEKKLKTLVSLHSCADLGFNNKHVA